MSIKKVLGRLLLSVVLEIGALSGVSMTPEQIETLMEIMTRVKIVRVIHKERDNE